MKNRKPVAIFGLLLAVLLTLGASRARADILPPVSINFAPVGLTLDQTAQLNLVNIGVTNGMLVTWRFIDASGNPLKQSTVILPLGKIVTADFKRPTGSTGQLRAEMRAQVDILTGGVSSESLRRSLEVFNNDTGATTVVMGGASP